MQLYNSEYNDPYKFGKADSYVIGSMMILVALMFLNSMNLVKISLESDIENHYEVAGLNEP